MADALRLRLLGDIAVERNGEPVALPPSKKTRALLAYLVLNPRPQRRDRLCDLLWDVPDDPRGALRWSLSKIRGLVDGPDTPRIIADRETVRFEPAGAVVDVAEIAAASADLEGAATDRLAALALAFRGEFLEGLDLPDSHRFQAWCVAEREDLRVVHARVLRALVGRLGDTPAAALPHARMLAQVEPGDEAAQADLARLLDAVGRRREALDHLKAAERVLDDLGPGRSGALALAWRDLRDSPAAEARGAATPPQDVAQAAAPSAVIGELEGLVGREDEWARMAAALETCRRGHRQIVLLTGEPGVGKSSLLAQLAEAARAQGATVLEGAAFEAEIDHPYGPWVDALRGLSPLAIGDTLGAGLAPLLPELGGGGADAELSPDVRRDRLFGTVAELISARAHIAPPVVLICDDIQWCDAASAALLHYVARLNRHRPVLIALAARSGELPDNEPVLGVLRGLRRDAGFVDLPVEPLDAAATAELVHRIAPKANAETERIYAESAGNPLFALEILRVAEEAGSGMSRTLRDLVRDRIARLPAAAVEVLRWASVLGPTFDLRRLAALTPVNKDELPASLEVLERHTLLRASDRDNGGGRRAAYAFSHEIVHRAVYSDLSEPRRRLMHWRIAEAIEAASEAGGTAATDLAHHAGLAGEAEVAARAYVAAGRDCLRLFANAEAHALARRGMGHAETLEEPLRTQRLIELVDVSLASRHPTSRDALAAEIEALAETALDHGCQEHARLAYHMLSYLRWEGGALMDARSHSLRAEMVSRSADGRDRVIAMGEAARCLVLLEHDLPQAESLVLEASAIGRRLGLESSAVAAADGMLRLYRGEYGSGAERLRHARDLARRDGDRLGEFQALEYAVLLELHRGDAPQAELLATDLLRIGERLREGSELPFARALLSVTRLAGGDDGAAADMAPALEDLRVADAKHRLAMVLTAAAEVTLKRGDAAMAVPYAEEALRMATVMNRHSESVAAQLVLGRAEAAAGNGDAALRRLAAIEPRILAGAALPLREAVGHLRDALAAGAVATIT